MPFLVAKIKGESMTKSEQLEIAIEIIECEIEASYKKKSNVEALTCAIQVLKDKIKELETKED